MGFGARNGGMGGVGGGGGKERLTATAGSIGLLYETGSDDTHPGVSLLM